MAHSLDLQLYDAGGGGDPRWCSGLLREHCSQQGADVISFFMLGGMLASMFGSVLAQPFGTRFCKVKLSFWINILNAALGVACFWLPLEFWVIPLIAHVFIQIVGR